MNQKKAPWQLIVGAIAIAYIVFMWAEKGILAGIANIPKEQILPMLALSGGVSAVKFIIFAAIVFLAKWLISLVRNKK